ncbi:helix-turn-helix domain-containing protein, partial [Arthrobacter sp. H5]|uniref:helix-turn-helix domain-containing protein n=1 Tax=Arthrobacter sp. H5 TaxID=1267973 RepID=UPI0012DE81F3
AAIAADVGMHIDTVRKWRHRFYHHRLEGLADLPRTGRPPTFTAVQVAEVKQLACTLPAETQIPLSRWSSLELATEATRRGIAASMLASSVRRWLNADAIKPWVLDLSP